jgi:hypothetical protein
MFDAFWERVDAEVLEAFATGSAQAIAARIAGSGATWTYQTSDQAFPGVMERLLARVRQLVRPPATGRPASDGRAAGRRSPSSPASATPREG